MFPIPARALVDESVPDEARLIHPAHPRDDARRAASRRQQVRAEPAGSVSQRQHRAVPLRRLPLAPAEDEPRASPAARDACARRPASDRSCGDGSEPRRRRRSAGAGSSPRRPPPRARDRRSRAPRRSPGRAGSGSRRPGARRRGRAGAERCDGASRPSGISRSVPLARRCWSSSSTALKIASENVGYGWIVSRRTSSGTCCANRERELARAIRPPRARPRPRRRARAVLRPRRA